MITPYPYYNSHMTIPPLNSHFFNHSPHSTMISNNNSSSSSSHHHDHDHSLTTTHLMSFLSQIQMIELCLALVVFMIIHCLNQRRHQGLPSWPLVGMLPSLVLGLQENMYEWISDVLARKNGTFVFRGPWFTNLNCVVTSDPRNIEYLLKTRFSNFPKGQYFRYTLRDLLGDGIFSADDDTWQKQRKTASLEFHSAKFRQMTTDSLLELVHARLLPVLHSSAAKSSSIDLQVMPHPFDIIPPSTKSIHTFMDTVS